MTIKNFGKIKDENSRLIGCSDLIGEWAYMKIKEAISESISYGAPANQKAVTGDCILWVK